MTTTTQIYKPVPNTTVGDVDTNGDLTIVDAVRIQRHLAGIDAGPFDKELADVNRDDTIDIVDAVLIQQTLAGLRTPKNAVVDAVDIPITVPAGNLINVFTTIDNAGGLGTIQTIEYRLAATVDGLTGNATEQIRVVDLAPNNSTNMTVALQTTGLLPGEYAVGVFTDDANDISRFNVTAPDQSTVDYSSIFHYSYRPDQRKLPF